MSESEPWISRNLSEYQELVWIKPLDIQKSVRTFMACLDRSIEYPEIHLSIQSRPDS